MAGFLVRASIHTAAISIRQNACPVMARGNKIVLLHEPKKDRIEHAVFSNHPLMV